MEEFVGSFLKGQILLLAPQPVLLGLSIFDKLYSAPEHYSAPVIICLDALWGWSIILASLRGD